MTDFYRRTLPHWQPQGQMFFITFRLTNSLPLSVIQELKEQRERERQTLRAEFTGPQLHEEFYKLDKRTFGHYDAWLDRCVEDSPRWLADERVARIVSEEIHKLDGERYTSIAYCLMSNHAHPRHGRTALQTHPRRRNGPLPPHGYPQIAQRAYLTAIKP